MKRMLKNISYALKLVWIWFSSGVLVNLIHTQVTESNQFASSEEFVGGILAIFLVGLLTYWPIYVLDRRPDKKFLSLRFLPKQFDQLIPLVLGIVQALKFKL